MPKGHSTTNEQKRTARKRKARERKNLHASALRQNNISPAVKERQRGETVARQFFPRWILGESADKSTVWTPPEHLAPKWKGESK